MRAKFTSTRIIYRQYPSFYFLANEMAQRAWLCTERRDTSRYCTGALVLSYTCIETFANHMLFSDEYAVHRVFKDMSKELSERMERMSLSEKIEVAIRFHPDANPTSFKPGSEPFQTFDLLRQLSNYLVHYLPEWELVWSDTDAHIKEAKKLEKRIGGRFKHMRIDEVTELSDAPTFVDRVFNQHCARWAFESVQPILDGISRALDVPEARLPIHWQFDEKPKHA